MPVKAWVGLGGNLGDSVKLLQSALSRLGACQEIDLLRASCFYRSPPWGLTGQPDFINAVAELETALGPEPLVDCLQDIEKRLGRVRDGERWGPRHIDLDLLTYQDLILESDKLKLPHPRMHERAFVLAPLLELEPEFEIPGMGPARQCLDRLDRRERDSVVPLAGETMEAQT